MRTMTAFTQRKLSYGEPIQILMGCIKFRCQLYLPFPTPNCNVFIINIKTVLSVFKNAY